MWDENRPPVVSRWLVDDGTEELILDPRGELSPSQVVEMKLAVLQGCGLSVSQMRVCRRALGEHGPAQATNGDDHEDVPVGADLRPADRGRAQPANGDSTGFGRRRGEDLVPVHGEAAHPKLGRC